MSESARPTAVSDAAAQAQRQTRRMVLTYAVVASLWVLLSDQVLFWLFEDPQRQRLAGTLKGWLFVLFTSGLLFVLLRRLLEANLVQALESAQASESHQRTERLLTTIVEHSADCIFAKDLEGRYLLINAQALQALGCTAQQALGHSDEALFPPALAATARAGDRHVIDDNRTASFEQVLPSPNGPRTFQATKVPLHDAHGKVVGLFGIARDITEHKRMESELRRSEQRYRQMIERSPEAIVVHRAGTILYVNPAALRMAGVGRVEDAIGHRMLEFAPVDMRGDIVQRTVNLGLASEDSEGVESRLQRTDGRVVEVAVRGATIVFDGAEALQVTMRDITSRKQDEQLLQSALREKEALLKEVHHRVKNNLQVIDSLLRMEGRRHDHAPTRAVLQDMHGRIHAMALLHETLYRSGTFAGVELGAYLRQLVTRAFQALGSGAVRLTLDLATVHVEMDQATPCGLLTNELVSNCLKHAFPDGRSGEVRVRLALVDGGPGLLLQVGDTGVGLPDDFEARRQQSLGLQLASDLAGQIGGQLEIGPGPDAQFSVRFTAQTPRMAKAAGQE